MNLGFLVRLRAALSGGALRIGHRPNMPYLPKLRYRHGKIEIGDRLFTECGVVLDAQSGKIEIGNNVSLNDYSIVLGHGGVRIGDNTRIAAHVVIVSFEHSYEDATVLIKDQPIKKGRVEIGRDVWIAAGAKVLAGSNIADGCVIGANSVVKGATEPFGVYVGSPARLVKKRNLPETTGPDTTGREQ
ncbi:acyltransferase [Rhizobium sp. NPDC090275]|uniref:acyltransferase n=1 Tax=Rhizobium sp. NPDC090275 TaxID=3364498 RepID=UPI00383AA54B